MFIQVLKLKIVYSKWFASKKLLENHIQYISESLNYYSSKYEELYLFGTFTLHKKWSFPLRISSVSKCHQICSLLRIWSHLLKKTLMENFVFYAVLFGNAYSGVLHTIFNLKNLIAKLSYFKNLEGPTVIDHILTNHTISLHHPGTYWFLWANMCCSQSFMY